MQAQRHDEPHSGALPPLWTLSLGGNGVNDVRPPQDHFMRSASPQQQSFMPPLESATMARRPPYLDISDAQPRRLHAQGNMYPRFEPGNMAPISSPRQLALEQKQQQLHMQYQLLQQQQELLQVQAQQYRQQQQQQQQQHILPSTPQRFSTEAVSDADAADMWSRRSVYATAHGQGQPPFPNAFAGQARQSCPGALPLSNFDSDHFYHSRVLNARAPAAVAFTPTGVRTDEWTPPSHESVVTVSNVKLPAGRPVPRALDVQKLQQPYNRNAFWGVVMGESSSVGESPRVHRYSESLADSTSRSTVLSTEDSVFEGSKAAPKQARARGRGVTHSPLAVAAEGLALLGQTPETRSPRQLDALGIRRPFQCGMCSVGFFQKSALKSHIRVVHNKERPFACSQCDVTFGHKGDLNRHKLVKHENQRPYACAVCQSAFGRKSVLKRHMEKVHKA
ncbi:Zinc finger protein [Porphyridium purpureum]|uniref:Zinc finger protein n=1 Tax=Porphyridium purpureum TaxID=35688 RepID=A0A5J4YTZ3_PORPP|nr:Zinc finger protein [Porphyridium purpureum]|eukprot:POR7238..scf227_4